MREGEIIRRQEQDARQISMLYRQTVFLNTRMQALESLLLDRWSLLKVVLGWRRILSVVGARQKELIKIHDEEVMRAQEEDKAKTKIQIVPGGAKLNGGIKIAAVLFAFLLLQGCVTAYRHRTELVLAKAEGFREADGQCVELQNRINAYVGTLKERLALLKQLDDNGELRPAKKAK